MRLTGIQRGMPAVVRTIDELGRQYQLDRPHHVPLTTGRCQDVWVAVDPVRAIRDIGLCLSGGGYRAAVYHLGALVRLNQAGLLPRVRTVSSVSGGSIVAAFLVCN
jgi:predicted acylesterase/phospholipase RssA